MQVCLFVGSTDPRLRRKKVYLTEECDGRNGIEPQIYHIKICHMVTDADCWFEILKEALKNMSRTKRNVKNLNFY